MIIAHIKIIRPWSWSKKITAIFVIIICSSVLYGVIPLPSSPSWTSVDNDFSTGAGFADINDDGYIDFCTSNGNDMARNKQGLYYNNGGTLENQASWRSADSGYFGHLYLGDINNDGDLDMAVSFLGLNVSNQGKSRIYADTGLGLNPNPVWLSSDQYNSFDNCLGDFDLDGDLDLAVAAGDEYNHVRSPVRIYRNNNGIFENNPYWCSLDSTPSDCLRFADLNRDGYLDLIVGYRYKLAVFYNQNGLIEQTASWTTTERGWIIRLAPADYDNDGWIDLAIAVNGQLSGDSSRIRVFKNNQGHLNTTASYTMRKNSNYCSCVAWGDANNDGYLDLAAGGWWEPVVVFENRFGMLDTAPTWSWSNGTNLVSEALVWGDMRNYFLTTISDTFIGNGIKKLYYTKKQPWQKILNVTVAETILPYSDYCFDPLAGWISFGNSPETNDTIIISYQYSSNPDLIVTNWTQNIGNYLFSNTTSQSIEYENSVSYRNECGQIKISPNPFIGQATIITSRHSDNIKIYNHAGVQVKMITATPFIWNGTDAFGKTVPTGVYFVKIMTGNKIITEKIIKLK